MKTSSMRIDVLTIFPEVFEAPLATSILRIAREKSILNIHLHDLRDWSQGTHRTVDDYPYGGGPGMVMLPGPIFDAVREISAIETPRPHVIFLSPRGRTFKHPVAKRLSELERILIVCGRYEGFDERVYTLADEIISVGDYVVSGGEIPAMLVIDAITRLLPGALGDHRSTEEESFVEGLLEYPQYTRPPVFENMDVPAVLRSGNHAQIEAWRREQALRITSRFRPDLLDLVELSQSERAIADDELERSRTDR